MKKNTPQSLVQPIFAPLPESKFRLGQLANFTNRPRILTKRFGLLKPLILLAVLFSSWVVNCKIQAQAPVAEPVITPNMGIPSGNANCRGVAFGNSAYITILNSWLIYKSTDGDGWSKVIDASIPAGIFNAITFANNLFVIVGDGGLILTSPNGQNWTRQTSGAIKNLYDVQYIQSNFYVVGNTGTVLKSSNGTSWATITLSTNTQDDLRNITYGGGVYAIGVSFNTVANSSGVLRSTTGLSNSWTFIPVFPGSFLNKVQYIKDRFFMFFSATAIYTSTDATNFTSAAITLTQPDATTISWNTSHQIFNGFYDGVKFNFFGSSLYYSGYGSVYTSTNGTALSLITRTAYIVPAGSAFVNNKYFQYGNEGIVSSSDGITYKYPNSSYTGLASSGSSYLGVGTIGLGQIFSSTDFINWTSRAPIGQKALNAIVYDGAKYVAVGEKTVVASSDNGVTWAQIATPVDIFNTLAYGNSKYVASGTSTASTRKIAYSTDGITWAAASTVDNYYFKLKYVNGRFFALGYDNINYLGVIMSSTDGITWADITPTLAYPVVYFNDVVFDGTKYHFMGMEYVDAASYIYKDFFSVSTTTVTNPNSFANKGTIGTRPEGVQLGGTYGEGAFAFSNGHFVGSVNDINTYQPYVIYSADGISWTAVAVNESTIIAGALAEGNLFRLMGSTDGKITVTFGGALAVRSLDFSAALINGNAALKWQTASEQNTKDFVIEHSTSNQTWNPIGAVAAAGNSNTVKFYNFIHSAPSIGNNYYRLLQRDLDGKNSYSKVVNVELKKANTGISILPNPVVNGQLKLQLHQASRITIYNSQGASVLSKQFPAGAHALDISGWAKGMYIVKSGDEKWPFLNQ